MDTIDLRKILSDDPNTCYIGLHVSCRDELGVVSSRREFLEVFQEQFKLPFTIKMPCGEAIACEALEDIPLVDVPCPCGNPNHWLIRWEPSYTTAKSNMAAQKLDEENPWTF